MFIGCLNVAMYVMFSYVEQSNGIIIKPYEWQYYWHTTTNNNDNNNDNVGSNNSNVSSWTILLLLSTEPRSVPVRPISLLRLALLRLLASNFAGSFPWAWEFHPLELGLCLSQALRNPESHYGDRPYSRAPLSHLRAASWPRKQSRVIILIIIIIIIIILLS